MRKARKMANLSVKTNVTFFFQAEPAETRERSARKKGLLTHHHYNDFHFISKGKKPERPPKREKKRSLQKVEIFTGFHIKKRKMSKTFHKNQPEHPFAFQCVFLAIKPDPGENSNKNEQVFHKLFSKCGKLRKRKDGDVEN